MHSRHLTLLAAALTVGLAACSSPTGSEVSVGSSGTEPGGTEPTLTVSESSVSAPTLTSSESSMAEASPPGSESSDSVEDTSAEDAAVFDPLVVHTIAVQFNHDDYDAMIANYQATGDKEWVEATVTIDGTTFERVGLRLKGNSSLAGLGGVGGPGGFPGRGPTATIDSSPAPENVDRGDEPAGGMVEFGDVSADAPEHLPWLIRLDEFVEDQTYHGYEDFVVRSNNTETSMNEAVTLALLAEAGLASQAAVATRFSVNDSDTVLRLVVEHPGDDQWYETSFEDDGALYKAESTGDWTYRGDDPASYDEVFDQEGGSDVTDLTPLIEFLDFLNNSDDAAFSAELADRLDVNSFATYLAMMELVGNFDDIDGPGNNSYLWWNADTGQFTVVPWDMNLALGSGMGFPGGLDGAPIELPDGAEPPTGGFPNRPREFPGGTLPDGTNLPGGTLPEGTEFPADFDGPPGGSLPEGALPPGGGGFGGRSNPLVTRFLADEDLNALYETRLAELTEQLIASGTAEFVLTSWVDLLQTQANDLVSTEIIGSEAAKIRDFLTAASAD